MWVMGGVMGGSWGAYVQGRGVWHVCLIRYVNK